MTFELESFRIKTLLQDEGELGLVYQDLLFFGLERICGINKSCTSVNVVHKISFNLSNIFVLVKERKNKSPLVRGDLSQW